MTRSAAFTSQVEAVLLGRATHHMIRVPDETVQSLGGAQRVEMDLNGHSLTRSLRPAPGSKGWCIWVGRSLLNDLGLSAGDSVEPVLTRAKEPDT